MKPSEQPHRMSDEVEGEEEIDDGQEGEDPWQRGDGEEAEEVVGPIEMSELAEQEQRWKEFIAGSTQVESKVLSFALPLQSRNVRHVVPAVASIFARIKSMQIRVVRVHTDRAKEFVAQQFKDWCAARDLWHTLSPGDEPTQNSRVERIIGLLKSGVRTVLKASKAPITWWPLALRHVAGEFSSRSAMALWNCNTSIASLWHQSRCSDKDVASKRLSVEASRMQSTHLGASS